MPEGFREEGLPTESEIKELEDHLHQTLLELKDRPLTFQELKNLTMMLLGRLDRQTSLYTNIGNQNGISKTQERRGKLTEILNLCLTKTNKSKSGEEQVPEDLIERFISIFEQD